MIRMCVIIPSDAYLAQAGYRIRYKRIADALAAQGSTIETVPITEFKRKSDYNHDVYLLSKCQDARGLVLASMLHQAGRLVGVDLFDDYFSQIADSRFVHHRSWLKTAAGSIGFVLCSTPSMKRIALGYMPDTPVHVMNDPFKSLDLEALGPQLLASQDAALSTRKVSIGWFGIGDNPHFSVGLDDLASFGHAIEPWRKWGYEPYLTILTNRRALTLERLAALRRLSVSHHVKEWSEEAETTLIRSSLFCFLPVNAQPFSTAKSLNRAVTALSQGSQVLSAGYPLYRPLQDFVYRDTQELVHDLEARRLKLRTETLANLGRTMKVLGDPEIEARKLADFLTERLLCRSKPVRKVAGVRVGVVHGRRTSADVHKFVQGTAQLSIGTPLSTTSLNYDIFFSPASDGYGFDLQMTQVAATSVAEVFQTQIRTMPDPAGKRTHILYDVLTDSGLSHRLRAIQDGRPLGLLVGLYCPIMKGLNQVLQQLFPSIHLIFSEQGSMFSLDAEDLPRHHAPGPSAGGDNAL